MNAVDVIVAEHAVILEALDAFQTYVGEVERGSATPTDLARFVELLEGFIEWHHGCREEELLLATMTSAGVEVGAEALSMSRERHAQGRELLARLKWTAARNTSWTPRDRRTVIDVGRAYMGLTRAHLHWELRVLVPIVQTRLGNSPPEVLAEAQSEPDGAESRRELDELRVALLRAYPQSGPAHERSV